MNLEDYRRSSIRKELAFTDEEYAGRLQRVRAEMQRKELDFLLVHHLPNVCYLTGFESPLSDWYVCAIIPLKGEIHLQVCDLPLAYLTTNVRNILNTRWDQMSSAADQLLDVLSGYDLAGRKIGFEGRRTGLNAYTFQLISDRLQEATLVDASDLVARVRSVKSRAEISCVRQAGRYSVAGINAALGKFEVGATENDLASAGAAAMIAAGSEFFSIDPFVRAASRSGILHASYKRNLIVRDEPTVLEFAGVHLRYSAPVYATVVVGKPSDRVRRMAQICLDTLEILYENIKPGRTVHDVSIAARKGLERVEPGVELHWERHGYSVGIGFPPDWVEHSINISEGREDVLEPGMTFHTPRSLRLPAELSVAFSETVVVTETGCEILTPHDRRLMVI